MNRTRLVGVRFDRNGPLAYFDAGDLDLRIGDSVIAPGPDGPCLGRVVIAPDQVLAHPFDGNQPRPARIIGRVA